MGVTAGRAWGAATGLALRRLRRKAGLDPLALAAVLGVEMETLVRIEHGQRPDDDLIRRIDRWVLSVAGS